MCFTVYLYSENAQKFTKEKNTGLKSKQKHTAYLYKVAKILKQFIKGK